MSVKLEISYKGSFELNNNGTVQALHLKFKGVDKKILAHTDASKCNGQRLEYILEDGKGSRVLDVLTVPFDNCPKNEIKGNCHERA